MLWLQLCVSAARSLMPYLTYKIYRKANRIYMQHYYSLQYVRFEHMV